jgi:hypothetical protein
MEISREQIEAWRENPENAAWEQVIGPCYKRPGHPPDLEALFAVADLNGLPGLRARYAGLNGGQVAMSLRNRLRKLWRAGVLKLPDSSGR